MDPYVTFIRVELQRVKGKAFRRAMDNLPNSLILESEDLLEEELRPTMLDKLLRFSLWRKLHADVAEIEPKEIYGPLCSYPHWHQNILNNPKKLAWLLIPVKAGKEK